MEDGLPSNVVNAIVQTRNGFLWVGTDAGLVQFNGRKFIPFEFRPSHQTPGSVRALVEAPDGALWVGTGAGLARISRAALDVFDSSSIVFYHPAAGSADEINCLRFAPDGSLWVGTAAGLYRLKDSRFESVLPGEIVNRIEKAAEGHLLVLTQQRFVEWDGTRIAKNEGLARQLSVADDEIFDVFEDRRGARWFCTLAGLARREHDRIEQIPVDPHADHVRKKEHNALRAEHAYEDDQGTLWVQFARSLYRISSKTPEPLVRSSVRDIYSDRDGDLWAATNGEGLIRFKDRSVRIFTTGDGLPSNIPMAVLSRHDGSLWVGTNCGGVSIYVNKRFRSYSEKDGLLNSCVWSLAEDHNDNLWIGTWGGGLFRLAENHFTRFTKRDGLSGDVVRGIQTAKDGSLWIATDGGISHMINESFHNYTVEDGLSSTRALAVYQDRLGRIWAGTSRGIDRMVGERFAPVAIDGEILDPRAINFAESPAGDLYVMDAPRGIDRWSGNKFVAVNHQLDVFDLIPAGENLWFSGGNGLFRFGLPALKDAERQKELPVNYTPFGIADGMNSTQCSVGTPNMALTPDGRLWVATVRGLAVLDLQRLHPVSEKSRIFVSEVTVGRTQQIAGRELVLPPGTHHTEVHFDSISLPSPQNVRFQYRMDGIDPVWLDSNSSLTAVYTNIPTGSHFFHVRACNNDGVWDPVGIAYKVTQQPQLHETTWFRGSAVLAVALFLAGLYRLRLNQIARQFNLRLEERVNERTRIARDLHDTLLQSFHGLMLRFQAVQNMLPEEPLNARRSLQVAIDRAAQAITEGRDAVQELRGSGLYGSDIVESLTSEARALASEQAATRNGELPVAFRVLVEGEPRPLQMTLRADLNGIGKEALANAFRHARASHIELDISYDHRIFRLRIRDDGIGMDPGFLGQRGREGHWGLPGIRERAKVIGGRLEVWSELSRGTEVELTLPAKIAYDPPGHAGSSTSKSKERPGA